MSCLWSVSLKSAAHKKLKGASVRPKSVTFPIKIKRFEKESQRPRQIVMNRAISAVMAIKNPVKKIISLVCVFSKNLIKR